MSRAYIAGKCKKPATHSTLSSSRASPASSPNAEKPCPSARAAARHFPRDPSPSTRPSRAPRTPSARQEGFPSTEHPGNHRPLARQVDPLLPRVARQQRPESKRKGNGEARITGIQVRGMNDHLRVLQKRVQPVAV